MNSLNLLITKPQPDYELLDSGEGEKLERFGQYVVSRPEPQALWFKSLSPAVWQKAHAIFERKGEEGNWRFNGSVPPSWPMKIGDLALIIKPTSFKHLGVFPEQLANWQWISDIIKKSKTKVSVLNLFGYTGVASLAAAQAGAEVCHVDASKKAVDWARANAQASQLEDKPIRWIVEDALKYIGREIKRGKKYDAIIMDPPVYGRGPNGESWHLEEDFLPLLKDCQKLLSDKPLFFLLNGYVMGYSAITYNNSLRAILPAGGHFEIGELAIQESNTERLLPAGIYARWSAL